MDSIDPKDKTTDSCESNGYLKIFWRIVPVFYYDASSIE